MALLLAMQVAACDVAVPGDDVAEPPAAPAPAEPAAEPAADPQPGDPAPPAADQPSEGTPGDGAGEAPGGQPPAATPAPSEAPSASDGPAAGEEICEPFGSATMGRYWINNNLWGQDSGSGTQCVWTGETTGDSISWGTRWQWSDAPSSVKSFASSVLGWHWGTMIADTGLPVRLSDGASIPSTWEYDVTLEGDGNTMNVAYDLWAHTIPDPTWEHNPTDEIMIWTYRAGGAGPVGTLQDTVTIGGATWELHRGNIGWEVFSFVRTENTTSVDLDLADFLDELVARGWMDEAKYLTSVQAGAEIFTGRGRLDTTAYSTTIG